jgi:hypothetical protein
MGAALPATAGFRRTAARGRLVLLLDAVNELPHSDEADYRERIALWRDFVGELPAGTRVLFSCRSLDYSASCRRPKLPVPHVRIEQLGDRRSKNSSPSTIPRHGPALWRQLRGTPQLDLFRSPFYLRLLLAQAGAGGPAAQRQGGAVHRLRPPGAAARDHIRQSAVPPRRAARPARPRALAQSARPGATPPTCRSAARCCRRSAASPTTCRRAARPAKRRACACRGTTRANCSAANAARSTATTCCTPASRCRCSTNSGTMSSTSINCCRSISPRVRSPAEPQPELAASAWRADEMHRAWPEVLAGLADADPLPEAPATGWEETFVLAAAMRATPDAFVTALIDGEPAARRPLRRAARRRRFRRAAPASAAGAGRAQPRSAADLRARIAAARALGELGDPRFAQGRGPDGDDFLLPPLRTIDAGRYSIGSDEGLYADESPAHTVEWLPSRSPASRSATPSGGSSSPPAATTTSAGGRATRRNAGGAAREPPTGRSSSIASEFGSGCATSAANRTNCCAKAACIRSRPKWWERPGADARRRIRGLLDDWYPAGRQTQPAFWNDPAYNDPSQPVVGICWHEARAYCAWLSAQRAELWRLPSEAEWEAAARGPEGRRYAWGDEFDASRCNTFESHVRGTTPIGVFPGWRYAGRAGRRVRQRLGMDEQSPICLSLFTPMPDARIPNRRGPARGARRLLVLRSAASRAAPTASASSRATAAATWVCGWCVSPPS